MEPFSSPFCTAPLILGVPGIAAAKTPPQAGSPLPGAGGEALPQILEKAESEGMWSAAGFHGLFPGHDNHI